MLTAIDFVSCYSKTLDEIEKTLRSEYMPTIARMRKIDPHDFVSPDQCFMSMNHVYGLVYRLILTQHRSGT